jgi:hypothetical protein
MSLKDKIFYGRRTVTSNEPILTTLHTLLLNYSNIKSRLDTLNLIITDFAMSERASKMQFLM